MSDRTPFTTLPRLSAMLGIPAAWLKREAEAGRIPSLRIKRGLRFNPEVVERVLAERAAQPATIEERPVHHAS